MSKKRITDDRKQLLIRYKIDEKGCVSFIDPAAMKFQFAFSVR